MRKDDEAVPEASGSKLPALSGPYQVSVADVEADLPDGTIIRLYYPCDDEVPPREAHWLPSWQYAQGYAEYMKIPTLLGVPVMTMVAGFSRKPCASDRPLAVQQRGWADETENPLRSGPGAIAPGEEGGAKQQARSDDPAAVLPRKRTPSFPVAVFSHGLAGMRTTYSAICADFASHGYVVAALEHRDGSACVTWKGDVKVPVQHITKESEEKDGSMSFRRSQLNQRVGEVKGALEALRRLNDGEPLGCQFTGRQGGVKLSQGDSFKGRLEMDSAVMMGHSFGGATSLASCAAVLSSEASPAKISACIAFDAWLYAVSDEELLSMGTAPGFPPTLFINNEKFQWPSNLGKMTRLQEAWVAAQQGQEKQSGGETLLQQHQGGDGKITAKATLVDSGHMSTSDVPVMFGSLLSLLGSRFQPKVCPKRSLSLNTRLAHSFLQRHRAGPYSSTSAPLDPWFDRKAPAEAPPLVQLEVVS